MNAIFICVIVLDKMCFYMLNLCWFKHKKIFECFRCFWKVFCFYKKLKNFKYSVALFWRLSRGSSKSHATAASSRVGFGDLFASERSSREGYTENFAAQLATPWRVDLPVAKNTCWRVDLSVFWRLALATCFSREKRVFCISNTRCYE